MKKGTKIYAARDGVVIRTKADSKKGGGNIKYRKFANYIVIRHPDNSQAGYRHLQYLGVLVQTGDSVKQGEIIGRSGKTGFTFLPHLYFWVWEVDTAGNRIFLPTRFKTQKGFQYLRPLRFYKSQPNNNTSK